MSINIVKATSTHNTGSKANRTISYIVIHFTAGTTSKSGSAKNTANYFATTTTQASADFIVDDATIVQYNPDLRNRYCWHCGGKRQSNQGGSLFGVCKNNNSIGVEICSTSSTGKVVSANNAAWKFTEAAINKAVELTRYLMETYGIDADHVIRHFDVTGKYCPGIIGWNEASGDVSQWAAFKARIAGADGQTTIDEPKEEEEEMTLAEFQAMFNQLRATLKDNDASEWSKEAREWAVETGLISGTSTGEFNGAWEDFLTREQLVTILYKFYKLMK